MFVFGSGLAIVPFLRGGVVEQHHWLTDTQFLDAVAVAMITPGPVVITVAFIGYLVAGLSGATVAAAAVFVPCWLVTIVLAPFYSRLATNRTLAAFVSGVTAAACGALIGAVVVLGRRAIYDVPTALVALAAGVVLWRMRRVPEPALIACAGAAGLVLRATVRG
jgi:chromate transporter